MRIIKIEVDFKIYLKGNEHYINRFVFQPLGQAIRKR